MQKILLMVDKISTRAGQVSAISVVLLTALICWEVFNRYVLSNPHDWVFDITYMLYGIMFMMAGAYTLSKNGHVRGDVLYGFFKPRTQALFDLILYFVFFIPGIIALVYAGIYFASDSFAINEHTTQTANGPPIWPFKMIIPIAGGLLLLQGFAEIIRCIVCLQTGEWPKREHDVEEVDVDKLKAMVSHEDEKKGA
uniref:TRAP transporter small permease subunit n=1 Tax=Polynucleobacter sp. TaxID=2029855 RepID=UPI004047B260